MHRLELFRVHAVFTKYSFTKEGNLDLQDGKCQV